MNLRKRLIAGTVLAAVAGGVVVGDDYLAPWFPCLLACVLLIGVLATCELLLLLPAATRPPTWLCVAGVCAVLLAGWWPTAAAAADLPVPASRWTPIVFAFAGCVIAAFLAEMARYREPGTSVGRVSAVVWLIAYLGLLPAFFVQLRFLPNVPGWLALTATIAIPKVGDIAAYFTGHAIGRHKFAPLLSPKKTWEGFVGGMVGAVAAGVGLSFAGPLFRNGVAEAALFGLAVGLAGVAGDLAESLVKRDCQTKDASRTIPGMGGVLDVIDSVLFAAPVAYLWLAR